MSHPSVGVRRDVAIAVLLLTASPFWPGCRGEEPAARFIPAPADAESAVTTVLEAWKTGSPPGEVPGTKPLVHVTDSYRRPGETLVDFELLGAVPSEVERCYAVALRFDPPREEKARYVVLGIDPLWVFRLEDFQLLMHWDHKMPAEEKPGEVAEISGTTEGR